jgi:hypothetical protein
MNKFDLKFLKIGDLVEVKQDLIMLETNEICFKKGVKYRVLYVNSRGFETIDEETEYHKIRDNWLKYFKVVYN